METTECEAQGLLQLLWAERKHPRSKRVRPRSPKGVVRRLVSTESARHDMGGLQPNAEELSASGTGSGSLGQPSISKSVPEEPDAVVPHVRICGGPRRETSSVYPIPQLKSAGGEGLSIGGYAENEPLAQLHIVPSFATNRMPAIPLNV